MLRVPVVLLSVLCVAFAAQSIGPLQPKPEKFNKVEGCYIKDLDRVIPFGEAAPSLTSCMEYRCSETLITYNACGAVSDQAPYKVVEDKTKLYPDCCLKIRRFFSLY